MSCPYLIERAWSYWAPRLVISDDASVVVAVQLGAHRGLAAPPRALQLLDSVDATNLDAVIAALAPLQPKPIGTASLMYADDVRDFPGARVAAPENVQSVVNLCRPDEVEESGITCQVEQFFTPGAVSGYEAWAESIAHVGVLVAPEARGAGRARLVASAASRHALSVGLLPQWRVRRDNIASIRVADALGFQHCGWQLAVKIA